MVTEGGVVNRTNLTDAIVDGVPALYAAAQNGDAHAALVAMRRFLDRLRLVDPTVADRLKSALPAGNAAAVTRRQAAAVVEDRLPTPRDRDTSAGLVRRIPVEGSVAPVMKAEQAESMQRLIREHRDALRLHAAGLAPRSTVFLVGPPGVGKTMTAGWLAAQLSVPLFELEIPALISSYLGRTGQNLREVFDFARANPAVILLDEFDAVAKRRDDATDLGEMRRIVSVLLKEIEEWPGPSVLVAATNHPDLIDPAVFRRFQLVIQVGNPGPDEALAIWRLHLGSLSPSDRTLDFAAQLMAGSSGSDIRDMALEARRAVALDANLGADDAVLRSLASRARTSRDRRRFARLARSVNRRVSLADLASLLSVSRTSIHNYLSEGDRDG
jgi:AAA+ superfamily predicted ATPase